MGMMNTPLLSSENSGSGRAFGPELLLVFRRLEKIGLGMVNECVKWETYGRLMVPCLLGFPPPMFSDHPQTQGKKGLAIESRNGAHEII